MAKWVLQSTYSSASKRTRTRTSYLAKLVPLVDKSITTYFAKRPDGEDVTVEVLRQVGRDRLLAAAGSGNLNTAKQDLGLLVALRLIDLFGASRIATYREDDGKRVSTRPARGGPDWVNRYTPHRLLSDSTANRIVLDTNVVRAVIHGDGGALDLAGLAEVKGKHRVSIADHAWGELILQLYEGRIPFRDWSARVHALGALLDPDLPVAPSGRDAAAMADLADDPKYDLQQMQAYYRAVWKYIESAKSVNDFGRSHDFEAPNGQRYRLGPLVEERLRGAFEARASLWKTFAAKLGVGALDDGQQDEVAERIMASLTVAMDVARADRLDLPVRVLSRYAIRVNHPEHPYVPDGPNDAIDFDVLFCVGLPAIVCTSDGGMLKLAKASRSADQWRVMTPSALLAWLQERAASPVSVARS